MIEHEPNFVKISKKKKIAKEENKPLLGNTNDSV